METRKAKMIVNKSGSGNSTFRATLPNSWIREMGLNEDVRELELSFDGETITIKKERDEMIIDKIERMIEEKRMKYGTMGTEQTTIEIKLT